jgi:exportin-T
VFILFNQVRNNEVSILLESVLSCLNDFYDVSVVKLAFSLFSKMIFVWAGSNNQDAASMIYKPSNSTKKQKENSKISLERHPFPGFDQFVTGTIIPLTFNVPLNPKFRINDGQSMLVISEIALIHSIGFSVIGFPYLESISSVLRNGRCEQERIDEFCFAIQQMGKKNLRQFLQVSSFNFRIFLVLLHQKATLRDTLFLLRQDILTLIKVN